MTTAKVSQVSRTSVINANPALKVSQVSRISVVNPFIPLKVSQLCRITIIGPLTVYCWAEQTDNPGVYAVTPVQLTGT
jgi:hypothetical protein